MQNWYQILQHVATKFCIYFNAKTIVNSVWFNQFNSVHSIQAEFLKPYLNMSDDTTDFISLFKNPLEIEFDEGDDVFEENNNPEKLSSPNVAQYSGYIGTSDLVLYEDSPLAPPKVLYNDPPAPAVRYYSAPAPSGLQKKEKIDLSFADNLNVNSGFSLFNQNHKEMATKLTELFLQAPNIETFLKMAEKRVNVFLCQYSFLVAYYHRTDTIKKNLPSIVERFPDHFFDPSVFSPAREEKELHSEEVRIQIPLTFNFTASDKEVEQRMAYFREGKSLIYKDVNILSNF